MTQFLSEKFVDAENRASSHPLPPRTSLIYQSFDQHFLKNLAEPQKGAQKVILKANNTVLSSSRYDIFWMDYYRCWLLYGISSKDEKRTVLKYWFDRKGFQWVNISKWAPPWTLGRMWTDCKMRRLSKNYLLEFLFPLKIHLNQYQLRDVAFYIHKALTLEKFNTRELGK